jgi:hypothetical protein
MAMIRSDMVRPPARPRLIIHSLGHGRALRSSPLEAGAGIANYATGESPHRPVGGMLNNSVADREAQRRCLATASERACTQTLDGPPAKRYVHP